MSQAEHMAHHHTHQPDPASVATLRWKLYRLAAKLVRHARGWVLRIKADLEKFELLQAARLCCASLRS